MISMTLQKGDFILIEYTAKVKETGEVFDTTNEETAKKERLYKEGEIYEPRLVVIGEGWVLKALDDSLATMDVEKTTPVEIPPDKAFGPRDPEKVRRISLKNLAAKGINPTLGGRVEYDGKTAIVRAVGAGRALLDFNPSLAGKTLVYDVTVKKRLEANQEKIGAIIHRRIPAVEESKFVFKAKINAVDVEMPEEAFYLEGIQVAKRGIALDIQKFFPKLITVRFFEVYKTAPKGEPKKAEEEPKAKEEKTEVEEKKTESPVTEEAKAKP